MTVTVDRQVRIITDRETADDDSMTVAGVRELAYGMNNYKALVSGPVLISSCSPIVEESEPYMWIAGSTGTGEKLVHRFAPRHLPWGYEKIWFQCTGVLSASPTDDVGWRLYASAVPYTGPVAFDTDYLGSAWAVSSYVVFDSDTHQAPAGNQDLKAIRNPRGDCFLTLTSYRVDAGDQGYLTGILAVARGAGL